MLLLASAIKLLLGDLQIPKSPLALASAGAIAIRGNIMAEWLNVMASLIPSRRAIRWDVAGQEMSERLLKDVNDGLYAPLPPPYSKRR
jgi:hypothetical protein